MPAVADCTMEATHDPANGLVHAVRDAGLGAATEVIIFVIVCSMNDLVHPFGAAGLGAVTAAIIFDIACYAKGSVHAVRDAGLDVATDATKDIWYCVLQE